MAYVFARGPLAESFRTDPREIRAQIIMSLLVVLLAIPSLIVFWSGWQLPKAAACTSGKSRTGELVAETKHRVFLGHNGTITSIPMSKVSRVVVRGDPRGGVAC
jgi:hypothetical protein